MPSTVTKIVDPDNGAGTDYTSLLAWEAAQNGDLTGVRDEIAVAECRSTSGTNDVGNSVIIDGWTTSATQYIVIQSTGSNRHAGVYDDTKYVLGSCFYPITCYENYFRVDGVQFLPQYYGISELFSASDCGAVEWHISNCIIKGGTRGISYSGDNTNASQTYYIWNNVVYDQSAAGSIGMRCGGADNYVRKVYNNTLINCNTGITLSAGSVQAKNNLFRSCATATSGLTGSATVDYNATDLSSLGYTAQSNDHVSHTFTFVDEANDDFHLASNDTGAMNLGVSDPGSGLFSDDIDGVARGASWCIGADDYEAAGGVPLSNPFSRPFEQALGRGGF